MVIGEKSFYCIVPTNLIYKKKFKVKTYTPSRYAYKRETAKNDNKLILTQKT